MTKRLTLLITVVAAGLSMCVGFGTAHAAATIQIGGGSGILRQLTKTTAVACTVTTIGHDSAGKLIGLTAGHCGDRGQSVVAESNPKAGTIGTYVYKNSKLDYAVLEFNDKVVPTNSVAGLTIRSIRTKPTPGFPEIACKHGRTTNTTCGVAWLSAGHIHLTQMCVDHGDSGSPVVEGDRLVGMVNAYVLTACLGPEEGTNIGPILDDMGTHGYGGFRVA